MDKYIINILNLTGSTEKFWCFLDKPEGVISEDVFSNSAAHVTVRDSKDNPANSKFTIPLQYKVEAGSSNEAVGLNVLVECTSPKDIDLEGKATIEYYLENDDNEGPLTEVANNALEDPKEIDFVVLPFIESNQEKYSWYSSLSFGVETAQGFMGSTWQPKPNHTYKLKPKVSFYVATGEFETNELTDMVSADSVSQSLDSDSFDHALECTVALLNNGKWASLPGNQPAEAFESMSSSPLLAQMLTAHTNLTQSHSKLVDYITSDAAQPINETTGGDKFTKGTVEAVKFNKKSSLLESSSGNLVGAGPIITAGTVKLVLGIGAGFTGFICSGITFKAKQNRRNEREYEFEYSGSKSAEFIHGILKVDAILNFFK